MSFSKQQEKSELVKLPSISIVVPAYNEATIIERCIKTILASTENYSGTCHVIVVDNNCTDTTASIVHTIHQSFSQVSLVKEPQKGVSFARNKGAEVAIDEYLLFLDADSQISPHFLTNCMTEIQKRNLCSATCYAVPNTQKLKDKIYLYPLNLTVKLLQYTHRPVALGAAIWIQRSIHNKTKGFHTDMYYGEDSKYVTNAKHHGKFGLLDEPFLFDMRRIYREGKVISALKCLRGFVRHVLFGSMKGVKFEYDHEKR